MQTKSTLATMMTAAASVVMLAAISSTSAHASFVSRAPDLPEQAQMGYTHKDRSAGNASHIACHPVTDALDGGCTFKDLVSIVREHGRFSPTILNFKADGRSAVAVPAAVPVPAAVWLFGSGLLGLVGIARRKNSQS